MSMQTLLEKDARYSEMIRIPDDKPWIKRAAAFLAHSGDSWFWGASLVLLWFIGPRTWRPQIALLFLGIFFTAAFVLIMKFLIKRPRPEGEWGQVYRSSDPHSFPSGHSARGGALAMMSVALGPGWFAIMMAAWGISVAFSRVLMGVHYASDALAGFMTGVGVSILLVLVVA